MAVEVKGTEVAHASARHLRTIPWTSVTDGGLPGMPLRGSLASHIWNRVHKDAGSAAYADDSMPIQGNLSPIAAAALALVGTGVTATDLVARLAANEASVEEHVAQARLDELCDLGLARAVPAAGRTMYFVTPLGERLLSMSFSADPRYGDLLAEFEKMRTELLSTIAHELRTPLTSVRTCVAVLLDPAAAPNSEQRFTLLDTIERNASRMQRVVGDILDLSRLRAGKVQLQLRLFSATELAQSAVASVAPLAESRAQVIELVAPPEPVSVFGDFLRLEQALVNLLANAEKYSPEGAPIRVTVASSAGEVSWSVADRGRGIKPEDQARLFERFFVASDTGTEAGIGLGLPIALLIAQAHGGRIDVESHPGQGSTFRVVVPAAGPVEAPTE
jgi:signal transduction histidine kinase